MHFSILPYSLRRPSDCSFCTVRSYPSGTRLSIKVNTLKHRCIFTAWILFFALLYDVFRLSESDGQDWVTAITTHASLLSDSVFNTVASTQSALAKSSWSGDCPTNLQLAFAMQKRQIHSWKNRLNNALRSAINIDEGTKAKTMDSNSVASVDAEERKKSLADAQSESDTQKALKQFFIYILHNFARLKDSGDFDHITKITKTTKPIQNVHDKVNQDKISFLSPELYTGDIDDTRNRDNTEQNVVKLRNADKPPMFKFIHACSVALLGSFFSRKVLRSSLDLLPTLLPDSIRRAKFDKGLVRYFNELKDVVRRMSF